MPDVRFGLHTFGLDVTVGRRVDVIFTPSRRVAVSPGGGLHVGSVRVPWSLINAVTGRGVATLARTTDMQPSTHYIVSLEWPEGPPEGWAELHLPIQVPLSGGELSDLVSIPPSDRSSGMWWVSSSSSPPVDDPTFLWLDDVTGDVYEWSE